MTYNALFSAAVALIALASFVWRRRLRSIRRWQAALDAYAEREIRDERNKTFPARCSPGGSHVENAN